MGDSAHRQFTVISLIEGSLLTDCTYVSAGQQLVSARLHR